MSNRDWSPQKLKANHFRIMELLLAGKTQREVAAEVKMNEGHLSLIVNSDLFQQEMRNQVQDRLEKARLRLQGAAENAVVKLRKLMEESKNDAVQLNAAKEILDRASIRGNGPAVQDSGTAEAVLKELARAGRKVASDSSEEPTPEPDLLQ